MTDTDNRLWTRFRWIMWAGAAFVLLLPLVARAPWTASDYLMMALLLGTACVIVELGMRASRNGSYRLASLVAAGTGFLLVWVNLAVGFLGNENNPANLMFAGVLAVAIAGALLARGDAAGLAKGMLAAAAAQAIVGPVALAGGMASPGGQGLYEVAMGTTLFSGLWVLAGWLFRRSARGVAVRAA